MNMFDVFIEMILADSSVEDRQIFIAINSIASSLEQ
jgi:hypothetical protein